MIEVADTVACLPGTAPPAVERRVLVAQALSPGMAVNVYNDAGTAKVRKAIATSVDMLANGFVMDAASVGQMVNVYSFGLNNAVSGLTPGVLYLSATTAGAYTSTAPTTPNLAQELGFAIAPTMMAFQRQPVAGGGGASKYQLGAAWSGSGMALVAATADRVARTVPATGTIKKCTVLGAGGPGSVVVDIWRNTYAAYPPTVADTIVASSKPTITAAHKSVDATLTGWSTAVTAGDVLLFVINSASTLTAAQVILDIEV